jgi:hypothetical protein
VERKIDVAEMLWTLGSLYPAFRRLLLVSREQAQLYREENGDAVQT